MNKIKDTSPDKVNGRAVKYMKGDCLSIQCGPKYLAVLVSRKFNKYYDLTLLEYHKEEKPGIEDFIEGKVFGTRFGSWEELTYAVNVRMIECKYIDSSSQIEKIGSVVLDPSVEIDEYAYFNNTGQLLLFYLEELPIRIEKSRNAEKFPDLAFVSKHLIDMKNIMEKSQAFS